MQSVNDLLSRNTAAWKPTVKTINEQLDQPSRRHACSPSRETCDGFEFVQRRLQKPGQVAVVSLDAKGGRQIRHGHSQLVVLAFEQINGVTIGSPNSCSESHAFTILQAQELTT